MANPLPEAEQLDQALHDRVLAEALEAAASAQVSGKDTTPFLLDYLHSHTAGTSVDVKLGDRAQQLPARRGDRRR